VGSAIFLVVAIAVIAVGSVVLWFRHRKPRTFMTSIDDFQREMTALGDPNGGRSPRRRAGVRPPTSRR
jgi:hypothetical protein